jgi:uncharacterized protein
MTFRHFMKIKLNTIPDSGTHDKGKLDAKDYDIPNEGISDWDTIHYDFTLQKTETDLIVSGSLSTSFKVVCGRCAEPIPWEVKIPDFCKVVQFKNGEDIDLTDDIREDILLNLSMAPRCQLTPEQKCPISGEYYGESPETVTEDIREDVWGVLDQLNLDKEEETKKNSPSQNSSKKKKKD